MLRFSLLISLVSLALFFQSCGKGESTTLPKATIDQLTGSTWIRYGFKSPVNGKEVYYYFTFRKNAQIDSYIKYNKTELASDGAETGSYTDVTLSNETSKRTLRITLKGVDYQADVSGNRLTFHNPSGDLIYVKE